MHRVLRAVLTCLLLIAVPLQGYAATGMLFCGTSNAGAAATARHYGADGPATDPAQGDARASHEHGRHHADGGGHGTTASVDDLDGLDLHQVAHGKCSACGSCCSAAALPTAAMSTTTRTPAVAPAVEHAHADPEHGHARPERPPRLRLV